MAFRPRRSESIDRGQLFAPDVMTPQQYFESTQKTDYSGEKRLMLAVLEDAISTYQRYALEHTRMGKRLFLQVRDWIQSRDKTWLYSFENICMALDLNPDFLRRGLEEWWESRQDSAIRHAAGEEISLAPLPALRRSVIGRPHNVRLVRQRTPLKKKRS